MFLLKRLEIQGFKSFVEKTTLTLPTRITAIVGPNGSGKSNIADAVQWVLGEQSARSLRGTTMEDVIFNGAARRRPLGMAEVSLTLESRGGGDHWAEHGGEVTITRRVNRDAESDYILNGKRSRLKDIQDLVLGTGLGVRAYSIIEQQKVDLILSTKPQDRRRLIEEAAGVSRYKTRKRQAEVKLEETRGNLLRLTDIVSEVERTCASLKRQASRAARWREHAEALSAVRRRLARLRGDRLKAAIEEGTEALRRAAEAEAKGLAEVGRREARLVEARHAADEDERRLREISDALAAARESLLSAEAAAKAAERDAEETAARRQLLQSQMQEAEADRLRAVEEAARSRTLASQVEEDLLAASDRAASAAAALAEVARREEELSALREAARRDLLAAGARAADAVNQEREAGLLVDRLTFALGKHGERNERAAVALADREAAANRANAEAGVAAHSLSQARRRLDELTTDRLRAEEEASVLARERQALLQTLADLAVAIAALKTTQRERETGGEAARRALQAAGLGARKVLADHFEPRAGSETALDAALGAAMEAPVLPDLSALVRALSAVREGKLGTVRFIHPIPQGPAPEKPKDDRVLGLTRDFLSPVPGSNELLPALPDALVVATLDHALALAPLHPGRTIVSLDGVAVRGSLVEAVGTDVPGEGLMTVRRDLKAFGAERDALTARLGALELRIENAAAERGELGASAEAALAACRAAERDQSEAQARAEAASEELLRARREREVLAEEEEALCADLSRARRGRDEATLLASRRNEEAATVERTIEELQSGIDAARSSRLAAGEADAAARGARDVLLERRRAVLDAAEVAAARAGAEGRRTAELDAEISDLFGRHGRALAAAREARKTREVASARAASAEQQREIADRTRQERHAGLEAAEKALSEARELLDAARQARFEAELALERRRADQDHLAEQCRRDFGCSPAELPPAAEGEPLPDEETLAGEAAERAAALERLGPVNHAALEEYAVESKRLEELSAQKEDLQASLAQIEETIRTINQTSSRRFHEAFLAINANFGRVFQRLFRGGTASLHLLDENDPLESGLEILAQPPGKRNQTIGLLSGGEKALTAIALLVGIFQYRPSPFCILDEVDAPLDEANIDRFTSLLLELSEETQFVLITHSKRTMETAQALYGVTQEEPGVSKLVSVRFD